MRKGKCPKAQAEPQTVRARSNRVHQLLGYGVCSARSQGGPPVGRNCERDDRTQAAIVHKAYYTTITRLRDREHRIGEAATWMCGRRRST